MFAKLLNVFHRRFMKMTTPIKLTVVGSKVINAILEESDSRDKDEILEVGDINLENRTTVDFMEGADYVGDIRAFFSSDYEFTDSLSLLKMRLGSFSVIRLQHFLEHIQWTHQDACLSWAHSLLLEGGMIYIETPNLEYIAKMYLKNLKNIELGKDVKFPDEEYPGMSDDSKKHEVNMINFWRWINFKIYSGCSPGDFHHCCYDPYWLVRMMQNAGFVNISVCARDTIRVIAFKSSQVDNNSVDQMLDEQFK